MAMAFILHLIFFTVILVLKISLSYATNDNLGIYGGHTVTIEAAPYMVALYIPRDNGALIFCGGSIIHKKFILTAAHCLRNVTDPYTIWGFAGVDNLKETDKGQSIKVEKKLCHKDFARNPDFENDICILKLRKPLRYGSRVVRVKLPSEEFDLGTGTLVNVTGWGYMENKKNPPLLSQVTVPILAKRYCRDEGRICAGVKGHGTCNGDSGGPLIYANVQVGIVSHRHYRSCSGKRGSVYTRVASYLNWIQATVNDNL